MRWVSVARRLKAQPPAALPFRALVLALVSALWRRLAYRWALARQWHVGALVLRQIQHIAMRGVVCMLDAFCGVARSGLGCGIGIAMLDGLLRGRGRGIGCANTLAPIKQIDRTMTKRIHLPRAILARSCHAMARKTLDS